MSAELVDSYLRELSTGKYHKRGTQAGQTSIQIELTTVETKLASAVGVDRLILIARRRQLKQALVGQGDEKEFAKLETEFIKIANQFSKDRHISYESWREMGVPARVLSRADIYPTNRGHTTKSDD